MPLRVTLKTRTADVCFTVFAPFAVQAGQTLACGARSGPGLRTYLLVRGGFDPGLVLGSAATFTLGGFGGV